MSASAVLPAAAVTSTQGSSKRSQYSLAPVLAMPITFLLVLLLVRLAAG
jgi:hypothetical protein